MRQKTQEIISKQKLHFSGVRWLDWNLDWNTDIVLSFSKQSAREFPLPIDCAHCWSLVHLSYCPTLIPFPYLLILSEARDQSSQHVLTNPSSIWHPTINWHQRSTLKPKPVLWREPDLHHFLPGWELAEATPSTLFELEAAVEEAVSRRGVFMCVWRVLTRCERASDSAALGGSTNVTEEPELWSHSAVWCVCVCVCGRSCGFDRNVWGCRRDVIVKFTHYNLKKQPVWSTSAAPLVIPVWTCLSTGRSNGGVTQGWWWPSLKSDGVMLPSERNGNMKFIGRLKRTGNTVGRAWGSVAEVENEIKTLRGGQSQTLSI